MTTRIARAADILVGYNSFPHTNLFETGQKAAELAWRHHGRTRDLRRVFVKIPLVAPMERMTIVGDEPMVRLIRELEAAEDGGADFGALRLRGAVLAGYSEMGCSVLGVARVDVVERAREVVARTAASVLGVTRRSSRTSRSIRRRTRSAWGSRPLRSRSC